jgi:hypothetical protein
MGGAQKRLSWMASLHLAGGKITSNGLLPGLP